MSKAKQDKQEADRCEECATWHEDKEPGTVGRCGECRRYPPTVMLNSEDEPMCMWPMTEASDFCGEFTQRVQ